MNTHFLSATQRAASRERLLGQYELMVLAVLRKGENHGVGIAIEIYEESHGEIMIPVATLYMTLKSLRDEGLIKEVKDEVASSSSRRRRRYMIISKGIEVMEAAGKRMEAFWRLAMAPDTS